MAINCFKIGNLFLIRSLFGSHGSFLHDHAPRTHSVMNSLILRPACLTALLLWLPSRGVTVNRTTNTKCTEQENAKAVLIQIDPSHWLQHRSTILGTPFSRRIICSWWRRTQKSNHIWCFHGYAHRNRIGVFLTWANELPFEIFGKALTDHNTESSGSSRVRKWVLTETRGSSLERRLHFLHAWLILAFYSLSFILLDLGVYLLRVKVIWIFLTFEFPGCLHSLTLDKDGLWMWVIIGDNDKAQNGGQVCPYLQIHDY